jgi:copper chaperone CopZ
MKSIRHASALASCALLMGLWLAACSEQPASTSIRPAKAVVEHPIALDFTVTGMHCGACKAAIETTVNPLGGVQSCEVSLEQGTMRCLVDDPVRREEILAAARKLGYGVEPATTAP